MLKKKNSTKFSKKFFFFLQNFWEEFFFQTFLMDFLSAVEVRVRIKRLCVGADNNNTNGYSLLLPCPTYLDCFGQIKVRQSKNTRAYTYIFTIFSLPIFSISGPHFLEPK